MGGGSLWRVAAIVSPHLNRKVSSVTMFNQLGSLAWPSVVFGLGVVYRSEIRKGMRRLTTIRYRGIEVGFRQALDEAGDLARAAAQTSPIAVAGKELDPGPEPSGGYAPDPGQLDRLAEISPRAAILESWHAVEAADAGRVSSRPTPWRDLAGSLRDLRDRVETAGVDADRVIRPEQARHYARLTSALIAHRLGH